MSVPASGVGHLHATSGETPCRARCSLRGTSVVGSCCCWAQISPDKSFYLVLSCFPMTVPRWHCAMVDTEDTGGCRAGSWARGGQQAGKDTGRVGTGT